MVKQCCFSGAEVACKQGNRHKSFFIHCFSLLFCFSVYIITPVSSARFCLSGSALFGLIRGGVFIKGAAVHRKAKHICRTALKLTERYAAVFSERFKQSAVRLSAPGARTARHKHIHLRTHTIGLIAKCAEIGRFAFFVHQSVITLPA